MLTYACAVERIYYVNNRACTDRNYYIQHIYIYYIYIYLIYILDIVVIHIVYIYTIYIFLVCVYYYYMCPHTTTYVSSYS
jgi:hypothetical protein